MWSSCGVRRLRAAVHWRPGWPGQAPSARLHAEVIHEGGLGALLRAVDAPDSAQFPGNLRPVPVRVVAAPRADDLVRPFGRLIPHALARRAIDQLPAAQPHERGATVVTGHARADRCHGTILPSGRPGAVPGGRVPPPGRPGCCRTPLPGPPGRPDGAPGPGPPRSGTVSPSLLLMRARERGRS